MGDRANVGVLQQYSETPKAIYLYGHWSGHYLPETVRKALASAAGRGRWDDCAYLARIVFDAMVGDDQGGETGFGIAAYPPDNEYSVIMLDCAKQRVIQYDGSLDLGELDESPAISFSDYCEAPERTWDNLTEVLSKTS